MYTKFIGEYFENINTQKFGPEKVSKKSWSLNLQSWYILLTLFLLHFKLLMILIYYYYYTNCLNFFTFLNAS